jgi:hypothetical protein
MVQLQAAHYPWLQYRTGGPTWADGLRQRVHGEHLDVQDN